MLHADHGHRIAVVQNEFGEEIGLERAVAMGKAPKIVDIDEEGQEKPNAVQEWLELPNGCICCTAKDNLVLALEKLVEHRSKFDYIFIETTGMADPGPLATTLWVDDSLMSSIYLDAIVTLVDAQLIMHHLKDEKADSVPETYQPRKLEALRQIALADVILINKIDLLDESKDTPSVNEITSTLDAINSLAPKHCTVRSRVDLSTIMNIRSFDGSKLHTQLQQLNAQAHSHSHDHAHDEHHDEHPTPLHSDGVSTLVIKVNGDVKSVDVVSAWFGDLLWEHKLQIYRIKGELAVLHNDHRFIVQGVHDNFEIIPTDFTWSEALPTPTMATNANQIRPSSSESRKNTIVFIGMGLDAQWLTSSFVASCIAEQ